MNKSLSWPCALVAALCLISPSYALEGQDYKDYIRVIIKSTTNGSNVEEKLFDNQLLSHWRKMIKKNKCFTVQGIDAEITMHQDSDAHNIRVYDPIITRVGPKIRATYTVFGDNIDKDFYLVEQGGSLKFYDVCDHPSKLGDKCYRHIIEKGECAD